MKNRYLLLLITLLGLLLPFGNIYGPLFIKCKTDKDQLFRKRLIYLELATTFVCLSISISSWVYVIKNYLLNGLSIDSDYLFTTLSLPLSIILIVILGIVYVYHDKRVAE